MQSAVHFNNSAALLIEKDSFDMALDLLSKALSTVQNGLKEVDDSQTRSRCNSSDDCTAAECEGAKFPYTSNKRRSDPSEKEGFLFSHPVSINQVPKVSAVQRHRFVSVIIIFNFALCHHQSAIQETDSKKRQE